MSEFNLSQFLLAQKIYETKEYIPGTTIIQEGSPPQGVYVILAGRVEILRAGERISTLGPQQLFGELALISGLPRVATVKALDSVKVIYIPPIKFRELYQTHPEIKEIVKNLKLGY